MKTFIPQLNRLQNNILSREFQDGVGSRCTCGEGDALYRCMECFGSPVGCSMCILLQHRHHPFHWIQFWNETHFEKRDLSSLDHVVYLGHFGDRCPHTPDSSKPRPMTIIHHNGVHRINMSWCHCPDRADEVDQLMSASLFPATLDTPKSIFSFEVLREFHVHSLQSKKSAFDYFESLCRLSDGVFTDHVPVLKFHCILIALLVVSNPRICRIVIENLLELHVYGGTLLWIDEVEPHSISTINYHIARPDHFISTVLHAQR